MNVLLINPPRKNLLELESPLDLEKQKGQYPPLGLLYLAAYLAVYTDNNIEVIDSWVEKLNYQLLEDKIRKFAPDIVGVSATTLNLLDALETFKIVKKINHNIYTVLGGPHSSIYPKETVQFTHVDSVILGEGEQSFLALVNAILKKQSLHSIQGIAFKENGNIVITKNRLLIEHLDDIPFPDRKKIPFKKYYSLASRGDLIFTTMMTSRGCPFKCIFCSLIDKGYRKRSLNNIVAEIKQCLCLGIQDIFFFDDTFNLERDRVVSFCKLLLAERLEFVFSFRGRVSPIDEEMLSYLKKAGCNRIQFGVEAGNDQILQNLKKDITVEQIRNAFFLTHKAKIETVAYFILGSPGETKKEILETIKLAKELKPTFALFTIMMPYPGTALYSMALEKKIVEKDQWLEYAVKPNINFKAPLWEEQLSYQALLKWHRYAYKSFYFSFRYIINQLFTIKSFHELLRRIVAGVKVLKL